jgi:uncharacterized protein (DUF362 family)
MSIKTDRRQFLKAGLITTATVFTAGPGILLNASKVFAEESTTASYPDVVVSRGHDPEAITTAAIEALGGIKRFVKPGNKVVIKPNMSFASGPAAASNTHPAVVKQVAKMCAEAGASRISILDNVLHNPNECLSKSQIPEACKGIDNVNVSAVKGERLFRETPVKQGKAIKSMKIVAEVLDADVLIAVPVGKSHSSAGVSLSMKGMMGLIFDRNIFHSRDLHESIVDMVTVLKPHLVVIDGTRILSTKGPAGPGEVIPLNLVVASADMVAADAQMLALGTWFGKTFEPTQVRHINLAAQRGLGSLELSKLNIKNITA